MEHCPLPANNNSKDSLSFIKIPSLKLTDCDACGCAATAGPIGLDALLSNRYVGIKYLAQHYKTKENAFSPKANQDEYFNTWQLLAKIPLSKKWLAYALIPYHHNYKNSDPKQEIKGLGDVSLMLNYYVYNDRFNSDLSKHRWLLNAGLKMPTGKFDAKNATAVNPSFQLGTGSLDWLTGLNYQYIAQDFALQYSADYIIKQKNERAYKFGNQFNQSLFLMKFSSFKVFKKRKICSFSC
jgi:hypothetical protein